MQNFLKQCIHAFLFSTLVGCGSPTSDGGELISKGEYSAIQSFAYKVSEAQPNSGLLFFDPEGLPGRVAIGLPINNNKFSHAFILSQSYSEPRVKIFPRNADIIITKSDFEIINRKTKLSPEVYRYIAGRVK